MRLGPMIPASMPQGLTSSCQASVSTGRDHCSSRGARHSRLWLRVWLRLYQVVTVASKCGVSPATAVRSARHEPSGLRLMI